MVIWLDLSEQLSVLFQRMQLQLLTLQCNGEHYQKKYRKQWGEIVKMKGDVGMVYPKVPTRMDIPYSLHIMHLRL